MRSADFPRRSPTTPHTTAGAMRTRKWKESGGFFEAPDARERNHMGWRYCLTVRGNPVEGADDAYHDGSWGSDPGSYDVNIYLRRVYDCDDPAADTSGSTRDARWRKCWTTARSIRDAR